MKFEHSNTLLLGPQKAIIGSTKSVLLLSDEVCPVYLHCSSTSVNQISHSAIIGSAIFT